MDHPCNWASSFEVTEPQVVSARYSLSANANSAVTITDGKGFHDWRRPSPAPSSAGSAIWMRGAAGLIQRLVELFARLIGGQAFGQRPGKTRGHAWVCSQKLHGLFATVAS